MLQNTSSPLFQTRRGGRGRAAKLQLYQHGADSDKNVMLWECSNFSIHRTSLQPDSAQAIIKCVAHTAVFVFMGGKKTHL